MSGETERALRALSDKIAARFKYFINEKQLTEVITTELLPLFNAGIAGAYAAATKHWPTIGYCFSLYTLECSCGWRGKGSWKHVDKEQFHKEWTAHILALTPADARQAQHGYVAGRAAIAYIQHLADQGLGGARDFIRNLVTLPPMETEHRAAIASAEARARLEEATRWNLPIDSSDGVSHSEHIRFLPWCKRCRTERMTNLEAAARAPDSTKEPE